MYRAIPISQRDGSAKQNENCTMAGGSTLIDFDTLGYVKSTGAEMRRRQSDQVGGTDLRDLAEAWRSYNQTLQSRPNATFDGALTDLKSGRGIVLSVWHATAGGPCVSGSGAYGHAMCVAPEFHSDGKRVLVSDPWCSPGSWEWWPIDKLRAGAEEWGRRVIRESGGSTKLDDLLDAMKRLMSRFHAGGDEDPSDDPGDTGGTTKFIMYSASDAHPDANTGGEPMLEAETSDELWDVAKDKPFFDSPTGSQIGKMSGATTITAVGTPYAGDAPDYDWRAAYVSTGAVDGELKRKVVYFKRADLTNPRPIPAPSGCTPEQVLAIQTEEYNRVKAGATASHTVSVKLPPPPK